MNDFARLRRCRASAPDQPTYYAGLDHALAGLNRTLEASAAGRTAVRLRPVTLDAAEGLYFERELVAIYTVVGHGDAALDLSGQATEPTIRNPRT